MNAYSDHIYAQSFTRCHGARVLFSSLYYKPSVASLAPYPTSSGNHGSSDRCRWRRFLWQHCGCDVRATSQTNTSRVLIHLCECFSIFGVFTVQVVLYYKQFPEDGKWVKLTVRPIVREVDAEAQTIIP